MFLDNLRARIYNEVKAHTTVPTRGGYPVNIASDPRFGAVFSFSAQTGPVVRTHKQHAGFAPASTGCALVLPPPHPGTRAEFRLRFGPRSGASARPCTAPRIWRADKPTAAPGGILSGREVGIVLRLSGARQDASNAPYRSGTRIGVRLRRAASGRASRSRAPPCAVRTRRHDLGTATRHPDAQA